MRGFLPEKQVETKKPVVHKPQCSLCGLYKSCQTPKIGVTGGGNRRILVVGSFPTEIDDDEGSLFADNDGTFLRNSLARFDINLERDCWVTAALICKPNNREPTAEQYRFCVPNLRNTIKELQPDVIVAFDANTLKSIFESAWSDVRDYDRWVGWRIPFVPIDAWVCPVYHPRYVRKYERDKALTVCFEKQLAAISEIRGRPYNTLREISDDVRKKVSILYDSDSVNEVLTSIIKRNKPVAFDYETNMLKPDSELAKIVCCGICVNDNLSFAFPMSGAVHAAFKEFLQSPVPKIGANLQFENRWSKRIFGVYVRHWIWDTVHAAHVLDNRPDITSVKFQTFVRLGQPVYNEAVDSFLKSDDDGGNSINRINQADQSELLMYCGLDALFEYRVAMDQALEMEVDLRNGS